MYRLARIVFLCTLCSAAEHPFAGIGDLTPERSNAIENCRIG